MTLATRVSLFFLAALAVVLVCLSAAIYVLVRSHLFREVNDRLVAGLETFEGATEFEPNGLEWEPAQRRIYFIEAQATGPLVWGIFESSGRQVDGSGDALSLFTDRLQTSPRHTDGRKDIAWHDQTWRTIQKTLRSEADPEHPMAGPSNKPEAEKAKRYPELILIVGVPLDPALEPLHSLRMALIATSIAIWLFAAAVGRRLCAKALEPVAGMARTARTISAADLSQRLALPGTHDEFEDLGRAFNDLLMRLETSFQRQQRFAAEASHQLRTPLTAMLGHLDVALRRQRNPDEYRHTLETVQDQAVHLRQVVEMLLFLTREDADAAPLPLTDLELRGWLANHSLTWRQNPRSHDIKIEAGAEHELWTAAHAGLLGQALDNLIDNACKYSPLLSPISIRAQREPSGISLSVEDRGSGIAADEVNQVFNPFFRSAEARRQGVAGTGLGLAVVQRIVGAMNGSVSIESTLGKGSRFIILLPVAKNSHPVPEAATVGV